MIQKLQGEVREQLRASAAGANLYLLDVLFEQPYCRIADVVATCGVSRPTASKWLNELVTSNVLIDLRVGRERLFINWRFLELLQQEGQPKATGQPALFSAPATQPRRLPWARDRIRP